MLTKIRTYQRYFIDYLKHREYSFVKAAIIYELFGRPPKNSAEYLSSLGRFNLRGGTIDFQFANYAYEWGVKEFMLNHFADYTVFLDIGACIGTYSILMARNGLKCHAFEPMPENFAALLQNVRLNGLENNIRCHQIALGSEECRSEFIFEKINTGASRLATNTSDYKSSDSNKVLLNLNVCRLDIFSPKLSIPPEEKILIKMDAEGMEHMILLGAIEFLKKYNKVLLVMEKKYQSIKRLNELLEFSGNYECLPIDENNVAYRKI